ncbi:MAG: BstXI family restriction endonuclease [Spirosomataceae bacterium]
MTKKRIPALPQLLKSKIYKTGQTRGADDDVIFQNRVNRNSTVLIPYNFYNAAQTAPDNNGLFENGFIVLMNPNYYFQTPDIDEELSSKNLILGVNTLLFYETRQEWNDYNPYTHNFTPATSRTNPLGGQFVARVPSTTSVNDEKITLGFNTSGLKGAGIRVYEYASSQTIQDCQFQLEYLFWHYFDSVQVALEAGMTIEQIEERKNHINEICVERNLCDHNLLKENRIIDSEENTVCPLCLEKLKGLGFLSRLAQAEGRIVPDLTVTEINLFHIRELRTGEYNHKPYNLGWGHHHCNVVCKDSGIIDTLKWMNKVVTKNLNEGVDI